MQVSDLQVSLLECILEYKLFNFIVHGILEIKAYSMYLEFIE